MKKDFASYVNEVDRRSAKMQWADTMVYFLLAAIAVLFCFLAAGFWQSVPNAGFNVPSELSIGTVCLTVSCLLTGKVKQYKQGDRLRAYRFNITVVTVAGILFCVCQWLGWYAMLHSLASGSRNLIMVLLVAHFIHFAVGLFLALYFVIPAYGMKTGSDLYIWFLRPRRETIFRLSFLYWDFLGYVWFGLFVVVQLKVLLG